MNRIEVKQTSLEQVSFVPCINLILKVVSVLGFILPVAHSFILCMLFLFQSPFYLRVVLVISVDKAPQNKKLRITWVPAFCWWPLYFSSVPE